MSGFYALRRVTGFLFLVAIIIGSIETTKAPLTILIIAVCLIAVGIPLSIYAFRAMEGYKNVFDYEPAEFWGKKRNGKEARETLMALSTTGLWSIFSGIALVLIVILNIRIILVKP
jgi:hypothetical protein